MTARRLATGAGACKTRTRAPVGKYKRVSANGGIRWNRRWVNVSIVRVGGCVGLEEIEDGIWNVYFEPSSFAVCTNGGCGLKTSTGGSSVIEMWNPCPRTVLLPMSPTVHSVSVIRQFQHCPGCSKKVVDRCRIGRLSIWHQGRIRVHEVGYGCVTASQVIIQKLAQVRVIDTLVAGHYSCVPPSGGAGYAAAGPCQRQVIGGDASLPIRTAIKIMAVSQVTARA